jgi:hypothetical protein
MQRFITPAQRTANALKRLETQLRNWQDDPNAPRSDVDKMLLIVGELRGWVQGHVLADLERAERALQNQSKPDKPNDPAL